MSDLDARADMVQFLAEREDARALLAERESPDAWPDDNFWGRLADGLAGPQELAQLETLLDNPHVRRRVAELICQWPKSDEPVEAPEPDTREEVARVLRRRRWGWAAAAMVLVGATLAIFGYTWLTRGPSPESLLAQARDCVADGRHDEARRILDSLLAASDLAPQHRKEGRRIYSTSCTQRAGELARAGRYADALAEADKAVELGVATVRLFRIKAAAAYGQPIQLAQADFDVVGPHVRATQPALPPETQKLVRVYEEAKANLHHEPFAYRQLTLIYMKHYKYALAALNAEEWLKVDPKSVEACNLLGRIRYRQRQHTEAAAAFQKGLAVAVEPGRKAVLHFNLAETYMDDDAANRLPEAFAHYKRFLALAPKHAAAARAKSRLADLDQLGVQPAELKD